MKIKNGFIQFDFSFVTLNNSGKNNSTNRNSYDKKRRGYFERKI
jgi:hypothetical protein